MFSSLDSYSHKEDASAFPGKRALISFLSWFDYCDQLIKEAQKVWNVFRWYKYIQQISSSSYFLASEFETHHFVLLFQTTAVAMAKAVRERFFIDVMEPQLMQTWVASYKTQQNRIWIKLIFLGAEIHSTSDMKIFCSVQRSESSHRLHYCTALFVRWLRMSCCRNWCILYLESTESQKHWQTSTGIHCDTGWSSTVITFLMRWEVIWYRNVCWPVLECGESAKTLLGGLLIFVSRNVFCQEREFWLPALQIPFRKWSEAVFST